MGAGVGIEVGGGGGGRGEGGVTSQHIAYCQGVSGQHIIKNEKYTSAVRSTKNVFLIKSQLCKLRVILRSRVLRGVYPREGYYSRSVTPLLMPGSTGLGRSALS